MSKLCHVGVDYSITLVLSSHRRSPDLAVHNTVQFLSCPDMIEEGITRQLSLKLTTTLNLLIF